MSEESCVVWFDIPARNLDRAVKFYSAVLAIEIDIEEMDGFRLAIFPHTDQSALSGCIFESEEPTPSGILLYFNVNNRLINASSEADSNGGKVLEPPHPIPPHGFRAVVLDSEGNRIALHSHEEESL